MIDHKFPKYLQAGCHVLSDPSWVPCVVRTSDNSFIVSKAPEGDFCFVTDDQRVLNKMNKDDARRLALWILENI